MANDGTKYARPDADGDSHAQPNREEARQGQNVRGMIWVLVIGIVAAVTVFAAMIAMTGGADNSETVSGPNVIVETPEPAAVQ